MSPMDVMPALSARQVQRWAMVAMGQLSIRENQLINALAALRTALRAEQFYQAMTVDELNQIRHSREGINKSLLAVQTRRDAVYKARFDEL